MRSSLRLAVVLLAAVVLAASCGGDTAFSYRLPGHEPGAARFVLVLPFFDARSFRDPDDPLGDQVAERVRTLFIEELREHPVFERKTVVAPVLPARATPYSLAEAAAIGQRYHADLVFTGQVFSFEDTRPGGIPPRAGAFVRAIAPEGPRTVFAGEDYRAAAAPDRTDARETQARLVFQAVLRQYAGGDGAGRPATDVPTPAPDALRVLVLPYHDRDNPVNLIEDSGGGAIATSLYSMELARSGAVHLLEPNDPDLGYARLQSPDEAMTHARAAGADFVVRGQVVEFRRAKSVPSFASAAISAALLAAQMILAEVSGVDIATEVYRVEDGALVFTQRDVSHQKYVVRAEQTVRRLAQRTAPRVIQAIQHPPAAPVEPLIDSIVIPEEDRRRAREVKEALENEAAAPPAAEAGDAAGTE